MCEKTIKMKWISNKHVDIVHRTAVNVLCVHACVSMCAGTELSVED